MNANEGTLLKTEINTFSDKAMLFMYIEGKEVPNRGTIRFSKKSERRDSRNVLSIRNSNKRQF